MDDTGDHHSVARSGERELAMVAKTVYSCLLVLVLVRATVAAEPPNDLSLAVALSSMSVVAEPEARHSAALPWRLDLEAALWIPVGGTVNNVDISANEFA